MEPIRRRALIEATMRAIRTEGYCGVTIAAIAREAGVSTGLAHHYFGSKEQLLAATMRALFTRLGDDVRVRLAEATDARGRIRAIIRANFSPEQFKPEVISAWLAFYMQAQTAPAAQHLLLLYHRRLRSNFAHAFGLVTNPTAARCMGESAAALLDGLWLRYALADASPDPEAAAADLERRLVALLPQA